MIRDRNAKSPTRRSKSNGEDDNEQQNEVTKSHDDAERQIQSEYHEPINDNGQRDPPE
jgi:hypothetical protein